MLINAGEFEEACTSGAAGKVAFSTRAQQELSPGASTGVAAFAWTRLLPTRAGLQKGVPRSAPRLLWLSSVKLRELAAA